MSRSVAAHRTLPLTEDQARDRYKEFWILSILDRKDKQMICVCERPATGRSSMNLTGTVTDFPTCLLCHTKVDGMCADSIPTAELLRNTDLEMALSVLKTANAQKHTTIHIAHANVLAEELQRVKSILNWTKTKET